MRIEAGTSCAIATRPTSKMMVASIISRMLKHLCPWLRDSADLLPGSPVRSRPNLRASIRKQNHGAKSEIGIGRATDVKHKDAGGNIPADPNRATRVKHDGSSTTGLRGESCAPQS